MKRVIPVFAVLILVACGTGNHLHSSLETVEWEMPPADLMALRNNVEFVHDASFRHVYMETKPHEDMESVVYYFNIEDGLAPRLYEVIMQFHSEELRDEFSTKLGPTNTPDGEWEWIDDDGILFKAWTFQSKLIIAKVIPGCEWDE